MKTATAPGTLDTDELLHLAWAAGEKGETDRAIALLKQAVVEAPADARCHYMLGAEYAQIGMYERAIVQMQEAVKLDPKLDAARFQLGLLQLTSRNVDAAQEIWAPLDSLGPQHAYTLFKTGLLHLARDEFAAAVRCLQEGLAANDFNAPLNKDMQRVLDDALKLAQQQPEHEQEQAVTSAADHLFINAYAKRRLN
jgi:tetratricopeptide (TPR) repeat protein